MRHVSVGKGGIFAVKAKDDSVWYRTYEQGGKPAGKVQPNTVHGALWNKIQVGFDYWMICCCRNNGREIFKRFLCKFVFSVPQFATFSNITLSLLHRDSNLSLVELDILCAIMEM
jgi:hypothetical protein